MKLVCPSCGATHSADAWLNNAAAREAITVAAELPRDVARRALDYVSLFRPLTRSLSLKRVRRLLEELRDLVAQPEVSWNLRPPRPNRPEAWARALEEICNHPPKRLPLENHNYLRAIQYRIADEKDAAAERHRERDIRDRRMEELSQEEIEANRRRARELARGIGEKVKRGEE